MTRVAVVSESVRLRSELGDIVRESDSLELVASVATFDEVDSLGPQTMEGVDVWVVDSPRLPEELNAGCVILSDEPEVAATLRRAAGTALLPAAASTEQIAAAISTVDLGLMVFHPDFMERVGRFAPSVAEDPLTPREREVLQMLAAGLGNKAIALRLSISDHTSKFHVAQILAKLNAASRAEAVSIGMRKGLVPL